MALCLAPKAVCIDCGRTATTVRLVPGFSLVPACGRCAAAREPMRGPSAAAADRELTRYALEDMLNV